MKKLILAAVLFAAPAGAWAADSTLAVTAGSGTTLVVSPDGSGNVVPHQIDCDRTTPTQCQAIDSSGRAAIQAPPSLPLPTGAATAANQEVTAAGTSALSAQAVQGVTGGVALPATLAGTTVPLPTNAAQETGGNLATIGTNTGTTATNTGTTATNTGTIAGAVTSSVMQDNIKQVNGTTVLVNTGATGTGSQRVTVAQDTTTIAGSAATAITGTQATVAAGTAPTNMTVTGCQYNTSAPAPTNAQTVATQCDVAGRTIVATQPSTANFVTGTANTTGTSTTSLVSLVASNRLYITGFSCSNSGTTQTVVTFQDGSGGSTLWVIVVPAGGGNNMDGNSAMFRTTSGNALFFISSVAETTLYCSANGFSGP